MAYYGKCTPERSRVEEEGRDRDRFDKVSNSFFRNRDMPGNQNVDGQGNRNRAFGVDEGVLRLRLRRTAPETFIAIFDRQSKYLKCFNPKSRTVTYMHDFNEEMKQEAFSSVAIGDYIYVLMEPKMYRLRFCEADAIWERMPDLIGGHGIKPHAIAATGKIIVAGGSNGGHTRSVTKYDPSLNRWERLRDKRLSTNYSASVACQELVYCLGGIIETTTVTDRVERLDVDSQSWDEVAPMREARYWASAVECYGKILVAGGWTRSDKTLSSPERHLNSVERYDPDRNQWTIMKPMKVIRFGNAFRCHLLEGNIYAVGQAGKGIEKYDLRRNEWEKMQLPDLARLDIAESEVVEIMQ